MIRGPSPRGNPAAGGKKIYRAEKFQTTRDWLYFCLEFDLDLCQGCFAKARPRVGKATDAETNRPWYCEHCQPALHPDLMRALARRENVTARCDLCHEPVPMKDCWISEDCQRVYCSRHLRPLKKSDRFRLARRYLKLHYRMGVRRRSLDDRLQKLKSHAQSVECERCEFNTQGIYHGDRLVEVDQGPRRCDSEPDTLNCADLES